MTTVGRSSELLTIVFLDVEGSTALLDTAGDEEGLAAVQRQLDAARLRIEPYDGVEAKSLGDGLLITFASPRSAINFAIAVQRALSGSAPRVRIGINTGEVAVADIDPLGSAVNAAARITARAEGGEILVSAVVRQLVGTAPSTRFVDRGRLRLKGFSERWHLFEVVDAAKPKASGTVGRAQALTVIDGLVTSVSGIVAVEGEAGIGKTHLLRAAIELAKTRGTRVIETRADEIERRPGAIPHDLLVAMGEGAGTALAESLAPRAAAEGIDRGFAVVDASVDSIESMAATTGVLVVAEDLQWADELSLRVLASISRRVGPSPIGLLVSYRPAPRSSMLDRLVGVIAERGGQALQLDPLPEIDVASLISANLGAAPSARLLDRVGSAGGNPLFVLELLNWFEEEGHLRIEDGVAELSNPDLPSGLRSLLLRRLSWLDTTTQELLRLASILGGSFTLRDLASVTSRSVTDVAADLHSASKAGIVTGAGDRLTFRHDLIREAIYEEMPVAVRRDLHKAAGDALAAAGAPIAQVAHQLALGARVGDFDAIERLERAAVVTAPIDPRTGIELLERAIGLAPEDWPDRNRVKVKLLEPLAKCGEFDKAIEIAEAVLAGQPTPDVHYVALRGLAATQGHQGLVPAAIDTLQAAAASPGATAAAAAELGLVASQMTLTSGAADAAERGRIRESASAMATQSEDPDISCVAYQVLGFIDAVEGYDHDALRDFRLSAALLESGRARWMPYLCADAFVAACLLSVDRLDEAAQAAEAARRRIERHSSLVDMPFAHLVAGFVAQFAGRLDDAVAELEAGLLVMEDSGALNYALYLHGGAAQIALRQGKVERAESALAAGFGLLATGQVAFGIDALVGAQADLLRGRGDHGAALNLLETLWGQMEPVRYFFGFRTRATQLLDVAHQQVREDLAREVVDALDEAERRSPAPSIQAAACRGRGLHEHDAELLAKAVELYRVTPLRPELADCCIDTATVLMERGQREPALEMLEEAIALYGDFGAVADLQRAEALADDIGRRTKKRATQRPSIGWESLTPTEERVVQLVAQGMTNPQIGERLSISRRTAETHLSHVFTKLGMASRVEVAAEHARRTASANSSL